MRAAVPAAARIALLLTSLASVITACAAPLHSESLAHLVADRAAVERVYYDRRHGTKPPFEVALAPAEIEKLVRLDLKKESILKGCYGIEVTAADVQAEVARIDATTRAPDILAELKAALGDDPARFAAAVARPAVVERQLRFRFDNDGKLHARLRKEAEKLRRKLLATKKVDERIALVRTARDAAFSDTVWQLGARSTPPVETTSGETAPPQKSAVRSANYSIEGTAQRTTAEFETAQPLAQHFEEMDPQLQPILRTQLQCAGDVSAVIETPAGFLLFVAAEKSTTVLRLATATFPKQDFYQWLAEQPF